jgi:hypothetical protein
VIVDNNTWNNTHIATVGAILALPEPDAWTIMRRFDIDYVMVRSCVWMVREIEVRTQYEGG